MSCNEQREANVEAGGGDGNQPHGQPEIMGVREVGMLILNGLLISSSNLQSLASLPALGSTGELSIF